MNSPADLARALVSKAADDLYVARRLAADPEAPGWILGFHAQQAAEKSLKAVLALHRIEYPRTHNLAMLLELVRRAGVAPPPDGDELARLIPFGVAARYELALDTAPIALDRRWTVEAGERTLRWAQEAVDRSAGAPPSNR